MKRSGMKAKFSPTQVAEVSYVEFVAFSQQLLQNWGVTEITQSQLYEGSKPTKKSPNDLRLGISTQDQKCQTCGETKQCQGHFGFIKLAEPVYHYGFLKYVEKILKCVCHKCCRVKRPQTDQQWKKFNGIMKIENQAKKLNEMAKLLHNLRQCPPKHDENGKQLPKHIRGCGSPIPTKISLRSYRVIVEDINSEINTKKTKTYQRGEVKRILQQLSKNKEDSKTLGFVLTKPIDLMIRTLAVPPPQIRPSIQMNPERKAEDDITSAYVRIIDMNQDIIHDNFQYSDKASKIDDLERMIASIMIKLDRHKLQKSSSNNTSKKRIVKNIKSISDRLKGKQGRFRQNLMGKRVDFSARSVVSPDSNLALDQLGVPQKVAHKMTVPEEVTKWNYDRIVNLCRAGKVHVLLKPAQDRLRDDDKPINVQKIEDSQIEKFVNYGMIAERCLQDGDYVLFNRQPTLHRMSMMGHRVRILPYNTFRLNLSVCTPYNADFDGDEMNMHVPQTFETISELKNIAHVPKQIVAPKNNAPIMGIVQDALLGIFLFTMRDTFLTRQQIMNLVIWIEGKDGASGYFENFLPGELPIPAILKPEPLWTGKQVMSLIIPKKITIQIFKGENKNESQSNIKDVSMIIKKGQLLSGALQKQIVGSGAGGLVHSIWLQIGPDATNEFITVAQRIVNNWLISNSFTVGAADIVPDDHLQAIIDKQRLAIQNLYYKVLNQYRNTEVIEEQNLHQKGKKILDSFEFYTNSKLNNQLGKAQKIIKQKVSPYHNNIFKMITAKSKGSETNLCQILFLVGNQNVDGKRCPLGFAKRALPHFRKDDNSPQPRGFVFSSFYTGLKPHEFFFHAMGGREGLSDTAVKTSRTGYIQRKLVKSLQDLIVKYDGTIRDSKNNFLQKLYGEDGFMPQYIENHKFVGAELSQIDFKQRYRWDESLLLQQYGYQKNDIIKMNEEFEKLKDARLRMRQIFVSGRDSTSIQYYCPIKFERLVNKIKATNYGYDKQIVEPLYVYERVQKLIQKCVPPQSLPKYNRLLEQLRIKNTPFKKAFEKIKEFERENGIQLFRIHLRHNLSSRVLCDKFKLTRAAFNGLLEEVQTKFYQALIPAGQSIGSIAAQSIGEPTTQMTLNTFHLAGVSDKNVTLGVPRLQQLLDSSKNIKTPGMIIHLKNKILFKDKGITENQKRILEISEYYLPQRTIRHYIEASRFYYDSDPSSSRVGFHTNEHNEKKKTPWVINLEFSHKKMIKRLWDQIWSKLQEEHPQSTPLKQIFEIQEHVDFNEVDDSRNPEIILRLYEHSDMHNSTKKDEKDPLSYLSKKESEIKFIKVGGISGIKTVKTNKKLMLNVNESSSINLSDAQKKEYEYIVFETDGSNLKECLSHRDFDSRKTTCNDMTQIYKVLGIEAARQSFINQFKEIIKPYGIYVNYHHLSILTDWMSMRGFITPVNRNGINRVKDISVLRKASYEETAEILFGAAAFSQRDYLKGISEKIIFGQPVQIGTSSFKIMIDTEKVGNYSTKAEIDKKQGMGVENSVQYIPGMNPERTPIMMNTPMVIGHGGTSVINSPGRMGMSPAFTPARRPQLFTPSYEFEAFSAQRSPMQTPLPYQTPLQQTPNYSNPMKDYNSPLIGGSSYYNRNQSSNMRSPYYYPGAASSSPNYNYSSIRQMSQSPDYNNSPLNSNYSSSPNYGTGNDSGREGNYKEEEDKEDDEDEF